MGKLGAVPVIGWFGRRNSGDEAFRIVHRLILPKIELAWLIHGTGFPEETQLDERLVIVSAGDIVSPFYFDLVPEKARIIVYGVGLGWEGQVETLAAARDRVVAVWVRNACDVAAIQALDIPVHYTPDIAFLLHRGLQASEMPLDRRKKAIVTVTDSPRAEALRTNDCMRFLESQRFSAQLAIALDYVAEYYDIEFMPFSFDRNDYDLAAIFDVIPRMKAHQTVQVIETEWEPLAAINHFQTASLVITTKFHGVIYAILNRKPFIAISDTRKVRLLCEELGFAGLYIAPQNFNSSAMKLAVTLAEHPETIQRIAQTAEHLIGIAEVEAERFRAAVLAELKV